MLDSSRQTIATELLSGETLLWSGMPRPGILLHARDWYQIPFGLLFLAMSVMLAFLVVTEPPAPGNGPPPTFLVLVFLVPWFLFGSYFAFGHLLWERTMRSRSNYGLTDQRAIIVQRKVHTHVKSIPLKNLADVLLTVGRDGVGTVTFNESSNTWAPFAMMWGMWGYPSAPSFELIEDARHVYQLIGEARAKLHP